MTELQTYRRITFLLLAIFILSNIGVPIVLASCPMMQGNATASSCCKQYSNELQSINGSKDYSCCKTVIAAERNTTEFVQAKFVFSLSHFSITLLPQLSNFVSNTSSQNLYTDNSSTLPSVDIPIVTSSLLI